ncbi:PREDICTED: probable RNA helicase armi [Nicrophorus vespilloides]|uniref:RNA helicase n=1 Tax=Nicrophorus vespilloides TaxID=110193 RepID=A0ABM1N0H0_NICVS|nr:PREDICTED: probable RNA helicase armi [Nicrophorus vespilloides]
MLNLLSFTVKAFFSRRTNPNLEEIYSELDQVEDQASNSTDQKETETEVLTNNYSTLKVGHISHFADGFYYIDNVYKHKFTENVPIGSRVSYNLYKDNNELKISNVKLFFDEWESTNIQESKSSWSTKTLIGKVIKREGRNIIAHVANKNTTDLTIDLNSASSDFVPIVGDWLSIDVKVQVDVESIDLLSGQILEIMKIYPSRIKIIKGRITHVGENSGSINRDTFFDMSALYDGYVPRVGDNISAEVIESSQLSYSWRAIKVLVDCFKSKYKMNESVNEDLYVDHDGIKITDGIFLKATKMNEVCAFNVVIENCQNTDVVLKDIVFVENPHITLLEPQLTNSITINKMDNVQLSFSCTMRFYGESRELIIFDFTEFKIGRYIKMQLNTSSNPQKTNVYKRPNPVRTINTETQNTIRGQYMNKPKRFINKLQEYKIPKFLMDIVYEQSFKTAYNKLVEKTCLKQDITFESYEERFHLLYYLEEAHLKIAIQKFDQERALFIKNGEYLMLEIENLSERRPSLIVGDKIVAIPVPNLTEVKYESMIYRVTAKHVYLKFSELFHQQYNNQEYSIVAVQSRSQLKKIHHAINCAAKNLGDHFLFPNKVISKPPQCDFVYDKYEETMECKQKTNSQLVKLIKQQYLDAQTDCLKLEWFDKSLNYYQKEAVRNILLGEARPLPYIIFGPPGTGKTVTIVESIIQILRMIPHSRILVGTPSNSAANLIALKLISLNIFKPGELVRLVSYNVVVNDSIPESLLPYCMGGSIAKEHTIGNEEFIHSKGKISSFSSSILGRHRLTIGTCSSFGVLNSMKFKPGHFTHCIIDEAGQATEPEAMIQLSLISVDEGQVILAGDPMQLGPIILSKYAQEFGLTESFLVRLLAKFPYTRDIIGFPKTSGFDPRLVTKLIYNYRSLPGMLDIPNTLFYHSELKAMISDVDSKEVRFLEQFRHILPVDKDGKVPCLVFHGTKGINYQENDSPSWLNPDEACQVFYYINELYKNGAKAEDIGIISPYLKQVKEIAKVLREADLDLPKIGTVEEFQGQEYKIIILSTVRSKTEMLSLDKIHSVGFVSNPKRQNVAITRAQCLTLIVGNPYLLWIDNYWRRLITLCIDRKCYVGCDFDLK